MTLNTVPRTTKKASTPNTGRSKVCLQIHIVKFSDETHKQTGKGIEALLVSTWFVPALLHVLISYDASVPSLHITRVVAETLNRWCKDRSMWWKDSRRQIVQRRESRHPEGGLERLVGRPWVSGFIGLPKMNISCFGINVDHVLKIMNLGMR